MALCGSIFKTKKKRCPYSSDSQIVHVFFFQSILEAQNFVIDVVRREDRVQVGHHVVEKEWLDYNIGKKSDYFHGRALWFISNTFLGPGRKCDRMCSLFWAFFD